ncbi:SGNH/GDSL hydrolase family protein [uncultured Polaribacter sp.]|uniref:SGNH/GDSL hydrolase family protein n=1 Tax=uncultured Polaribacter sp. TaxID=174711 RepID=UPI00262D5A69|nr:SGNH/GDSL hydrolase family protein [uncultured Polaribacter sp.]
MFKHLILIICLPLFINCNNKTTIVLHNNNQLEYQGRVAVNKSKKATELFWSGTAVKINFKGTSAKITLEDEKGENYFNVFIDGIFIKYFRIEKGLKSYNLAEKLDDKKHTIEITKRNEFSAGKTLFYNFIIQGKVLQKDPNKELFIEFYGDSITTGHGNEDTSGKDKSNGIVTNNYNSYAAMTARNLNADYTCIAKEGIGIMLSWHDLVMQEIYYRKNPADEKSKWNFSKKQPDIVVINLLQNDSWLVNKPNHKEYKRRLGNKKPNPETIENAYAEFVKVIREKYKLATIICMLGNMDITKENSPWKNYVSNAVKSINDRKIYTCFVPFKNTTGHPKVTEHKIIADQLTTFIQNNILNN